MSDPQLRRYRLRRLRIPMGTSSLDVVVPDGRSWMRAGSWVGDAERGAEPPYWVEIWPSSIAVARNLVRMSAARAERLAGVRLLDLGCGLGIPGVAAAREGAEVTFADRQDDALAFARWNALRAHPGQGVVTCRRFDWARDTMDGEFEIIVLADVSYRPVHHAPLLRQIEACLAPGGIVVHADPLRRESNGFLAGLGATLSLRESLQNTAFRDRKVQVRLTFASREPSSLKPFETSAGHSASFPVHHLTAR